MSGAAAFCDRCSLNVCAREFLLTGRKVKSEQPVLSLSLQAGFTLGIIILVAIGLLMLYCCYIVLKSRKAIRESRAWNIKMLLGILLLMDQAVPPEVPDSTEQLD